MRRRILEHPDGALRDRLKVEMGSPENGATQVDEDSDVADVTQVLQRPRRGRRRVSSDSDVPLVRGSRFAVLTESDDQSNIEPLI